MTSLRHIRLDDRSELASLWSLRFQDPDAFVDWYFLNRLDPAHSLCLEEEGRIVSVIHAWPMPLRIRDRELPALMLGGVATLPGFERRGYMHALMRAVLSEARTGGFPLVFHRPESFDTYASLGQLPCTRTLLHTVTEGTNSPVFADEWRIGELLAVYQSATSRYSGCAVRDEAAMRLKLSDYRSDRAALITIDGGYAVFFFKDGGWYGEEALAVDAAAYGRLLSALPQGARIKLPPDLPFTGQIKAQNAMGAADVPALLAKLCGEPETVFKVNDPAVSENCGVFDGCGRACGREPDVTLTAGELMQGLCGYHKLMGMPAQSCFCVDEY